MALLLALCVRIYLIISRDDTTKKRLFHYISGEKLFHVVSLVLHKVVSCEAHSLLLYHQKPAFSTNSIKG